MIIFSVSAILPGYPINSVFKWIVYIHYNFCYSFLPNCACISLSKTSSWHEFPLDIQRWKLRFNSVLLLKIPKSMWTGVFSSSIWCWISLLQGLIRSSSWELRRRSSRIHIFSHIPVWTLKITDTICKTEWQQLKMA